MPDSSIADEKREQALSDNASGDGDTPHHGQFQQNYRMNKSMFIFLIPLAAAGEHLRTHFACLAHLCRFAFG